MNLLFGRRWDISRRHIWEKKLLRYNCRYGPMVKKSVSSLKKEHLMGNKVLVKVDLDVPLNDDLSIRDETRIIDALPTIKYLISCGARVILLSHRSYPMDKGEYYSLKPLVQRLSQLLEVEVNMANDCIGEEVVDMICKIPSGGVLLLENLRFNRGERACEPQFAKELASLANYYVNDCFRTSNEELASNERVTKYIPSVAGLLMKKELKYLFEDLARVEKPFHAIVGGSRLSTRIGVIENLFDKKVDVIFFGGGLIFTFLAAAGYSVGNSLVEKKMLHQANEIVSEAKERHVELVFPIDLVIAEWFAPTSTKIVEYGNIDEKFMGLDIGPGTVSLFSRRLDEAKTIIWNGPMGGFEIAEFARGTEGIAEKLAKVEEAVTTIIVGGSTVEAVKKLGLAEKMTHVSTGGFSSLELLEGIPPCGMLGLDDEVDYNGRSKVLPDTVASEVKMGDDVASEVKIYIGQILLSLK